MGIVEPLQGDRACTVTFKIWALNESDSTWSQIFKPVGCPLWLILMITATLMYGHTAIS